MDSKITATDRSTFGPGGNITKEDAVGFANRLPAFNNWVSKLTTNFKDENVGNINILEVFPFGPAATARAGFVIANATVKKGGKPVPGFALIRGGAVAVLPILKNESGEEFVLTLL